jgi:hypothetical protein
MKRILVTLSAAAAAMTLVTAASAQDRYSYYNNPNPAPYAAPIAGAAVGTTVGLGLYNGWFGTSAAATALPATALGAAATGFVAGAGTLALVHAATTPCQGFHFLFGALNNSANECVNGRWVGPGARLQQTTMYEERPVVTKRTVRRHR